MSAQQANPAQLQHAIDNGKKLVEAKQLEIKAYTDFRRLDSDIAHALFPDERNLTTRTEFEEAIYELTTAKLDRAAVELEELEMVVKGYTFAKQQAESMIQMPNMPNMR